MNIYLDEAGDLGFSAGSSKYFIISFFTTDSQIQIKRLIKKIKIKYNIPADVELKASKTSKKIRIDLLSNLSKKKVMSRIFCKFISNILLAASNS